MTEFQLNDFNVRKRDEEGGTSSQRLLSKEEEPDDILWLSRYEQTR